VKATKRLWIRTVVGAAAAAALMGSAWAQETLKIGLLAAVGGVLMVWYNGRISPGTVNLAQMIGILIIAVLGGMKHPIGAFIGAIVYVLLQNFAIDLFIRERFNLVIGGVFLAIVLFSPDGLLGLWAKLRSRLVQGPISPRKRRQP